MKLIPLFKVHMPVSVFGPLKKTLMSGYIGQGPKVEDFEKKLTPWFRNPNILTVNSGTSAIHLALRLAGVGYNDEVISTAMTCTATNEPILERGARIVWADIKPDTGEIDPVDIQRKITPKTKAIVVVHWGGYPCDLDEINRIAARQKIKVIEDAAHAFGAQYKGRPIGGHSDFVCFSFQAIKHLTTVDGGVLACRDKDDYRRGKLLRWYGIDREEKGRCDFRCENDIKEYGYKFHMNDICATIGLEQLKYVAKVLSRHRANAAYYNSRFQGLKRLTLLNYKRDRLSSYWLYTLLVEDRLEFMTKMQNAGIMVSQVHARNDTHTMLKKFRCDLPGVSEFAEKQVSIPVGWWLSKKERKHIADKVTEICR